MKAEKRGNWYLLTGFLLGVALGLGYAWLLSPVEYVDTQPVSLAESYKDEYRKVIALAYQADANLGRARERAALIDADSPSRAMAAQAQRLIAINATSREARALAVLAADLARQQPAGGASSSTTPPAGQPLLLTETLPNPEPSADSSVTATIDPALAVQTATAPLPSTTPTITLTPAPTFTPRPTATPPQVQESPFALVSNQKVCPPDGAPGLLQVMVSNQSGMGLAGVRVLVTWDGGQDLFFTGLNPEISAGYADFKMQTGVTYRLMVGQTSKEVNGLQTDGNCGQRLEFTQDQ